MSNQGFSKVGIVVVVLILLSGGIFAWKYFQVPKEEGRVPEVANWKTYQNKEYNFAIDYPKSWHAYPNRFGGLQEIATFSKRKYKQYYGTEDHRKIGESYGIVHIEYTNNTDLEKTVESIDGFIKILGMGPVSKIEASNIEEINVQGMKGYKISFSGKGYILDEDFTNIFYLILNKSNEGALRLEGIFTGENREEYAELFKQMFSTFRFLE